MDGQEDPVARSGEACQPRGIEHTLPLLERVEGAPRAPVPMPNALTLSSHPREHLTWQRWSWGWSLLGSVGRGEPSCFEVSVLLNIKKKSVVFARMSWPGQSCLGVCLQSESLFGRERGKPKPTQR